MRKRRVLRILSFVVLASLFLMPVVFALFRNSLSGNGTLSTAGWQVSINQQNENDNLSVVPGVSASSANYRVNITSNSEVDAIYSIVVDGLPVGVSVAIDGGTPVQPVNNQVIFSNVGTIYYTDSVKTKRHTLTFAAASGTTLVNNQTININVIARQAL